MTRPLLQLPNEGLGYPIIASVSGGKDSTALILALREALDAGTIAPSTVVHYVFADTGWEADDTYEYLNSLVHRLGIVIDRVGAVGGMVARIRHRAGFPGRTGRFCTRELKIEPLRGYHDKIMAEFDVDDTVSAIGVRASESEPRSRMPEWSDEGPRFTRDRWGGYVWRPLLQWTIEDVLLIHRRHGVPVNPLYQQGHERVGCYPCIFAGKEEIRLIAKNAPTRIDRIRELEHEMVDLRRQRNEEQPGRYAWPDDATFFQTRNGRRKLLCRVEHDDTPCSKCGVLRCKTVACLESPDGDHEYPPYHFEPFGDGCETVRGLVNHTPMRIDDIVAWARTDDGGKQMPIFEPAPRGGCMRWGLCEMPEDVHTALDAYEDGRSTEARQLLADSGWKAK